MKRKFLYIILCVLLVSLFTSCEKESEDIESFSKVSEKICHDFLMDFYTTTEDEILNYENYYLGISKNHKESTLDEQGKIMDNYYKYLLDLYADILSVQARDHLISNREIDVMSILAYNSQTSFSVDNLEMRIFNDDDENDIVYAYIVKIKDDNKGFISEVDGQVRLQKINGLNLITAASLYDIDFYNRYNRYNWYSK